MNDADRIFAAGCLERQLLTEPQLVAALVLWQQNVAPSQSLAEFAENWGLVDRDFVESFRRFCRERMDGQIASGPDSFWSAADQAVVRVLAHVTEPALRQFFAPSTIPKDSVSITAIVNFRLLRKEEQGGLGEIWLARDANLNRDVAIKQLKSNLQDDRMLRDRFEREAQITGRLQHPNIIQILQFGRKEAENGTIPFYAMRFVEGKTFRALISDFHSMRRQGVTDRLALIRLLDVFRSVCQAIAYAHTQGVLHRDLKPENVMVGKFDEVVVLDWGLAKEIRKETGKAPAESVPAPALEIGSIPEDRAEAPVVADPLDEDSATHVGSVIGTPLYMAPEQAAGNLSAVNERSDIFGLGGILFCLLTDNPPHEKHPQESVGDFLNRIATQPSRRVREIEPKVAPMLEAICARALALRSQERYATANELAADVERWIAGEPAAGIPESLALKCSRWVVRRQRDVFLAGGTAFVLLLLAAITWRHWSASSQDVAEEQLHDSRYSVQVFSKDLLRSAESLAVDVRFLGESPTAYGLLETLRSGNHASILEAKGRFDMTLNRFASRRRTFRRAALVDYQGAAGMLAASIETGDLGRPIVEQAPDECLQAAQRARGMLNGLENDLVILDKTFLIADATRSPSKIWPRVRLVAPVFDDKRSLAGAIVVESQFGVFDPKYAANDEDENRERDTDWFMSDESGTTIWSEPGRYFREKDVPTGRPIVQVIPELAPMFQSGTAAPEELSINHSGGSGVAIYAQTLSIPCFRPAPKLTIAASTPREPIVAASARRQSSMNNVAATIAVVAAALALTFGTTVMTVVRRSQRCFD